MALTLTKTDVLAHEEVRDRPGQRCMLALLRLPRPGMAVLLSLFTLPYLVGQEVKGYGSIEGTVLGVDGKALAYANIISESVSGVPSGPANIISTGEDGKFTLEHVPAGDNLVHAYKEEDGYPNTSFPVFAADLAAIPRVHVEPGETAHVVISLKSRGGRITGSIGDIHGTPIINSRIHITRDDDPRLFFATGPDEAGSFEFVIPKPLRVWVTAPGYKPWYFAGDSSEHTSERSKPLNVKPDSVKRMGIILQREGR